MTSWDRALDLLAECLREYRQRGLYRLQAAVHEEMARCHLQRHEPGRAQIWCHEALAILDREDNTIARGHLYRLLALAQYQTGNQQRALLSR